MTALRYILPPDFFLRVETLSTWAGRCLSGLPPAGLSFSKTCLLDYASHRILLLNLGLPPDLRGRAFSADY